MKKLVKLIGFAGAAAAVIWAMRDRFISVAVSREPEPPLFRATSPAAPTKGIDAIDGIGPVFASRLRAAGLETVGHLAAASLDTVAESAQVSSARARSWIEQAQSLT